MRGTVELMSHHEIHVFSNDKGVIIWINGLNVLTWLVVSRSTTWEEKVNVGSGWTIFDHHWHKSTLLGQAFFGTSGTLELANGRLWGKKKKRTAIMTGGRFFSVQWRIPSRQLNAILLHHVVGACIMQLQPVRFQRSVRLFGYTLFASARGRMGRVAVCLYVGIFVVWLNNA